MAGAFQHAELGDGRPARDVPAVSQRHIGVFGAVQEKDRYLEGGEREVEIVPLEVQPVGLVAAPAARESERLEEVLDALPSVGVLQQVPSLLRFGDSEQTQADGGRPAGSEGAEVPAQAEVGDLVRFLLLGAHPLGDGTDQDQGPDLLRMTKSQLEGGRTASGDTDGDHGAGVELVEQGGHHICMLLRCRAQGRWCAQIAGSRHRQRSIATIGHGARQGQELVVASRGAVQEEDRRISRAPEGGDFDGATRRVHQLALVAEPFSGQAP